MPYFDRTFRCFLKYKGGVYSAHRVVQVTPFTRATVQFYGLINNVMTGFSTKEAEKDSSQVYHTTN